MASDRDEGEDRQARSYRVYGRVQGVGFRWWTRGVAEELGLSGVVRNLRDGSVEVRASGEASQLERLERRLREGPRLARVDRVETVETAAGPVERAGEFRIEA